MGSSIGGETVEWRAAPHGERDFFWIILEAPILRANLGAARGRCAVGRGVVSLSAARPGRSRQTLGLLLHLRIRFCLWRGAFSARRRDPQAPAAACTPHGSCCRLEKS